MTLPVHAPQRSERFWAADQSTLGTLVQPAAGDAVQMLEYTVPSVDLEFASNLERRDTPGRGAPISRKETVGQFSLTGYLKAPATGGVVPQYGLLLKKLLGKETLVLTVADYAVGVGGTVVVTIDGVAHTLTEGSGGDYQAETSNNATAASLAAAINALSGVAASASGAVISVTRDAGIVRLAISGTVVGSGEAFADFVTFTGIDYEPASDTQEDVCSFWHWTGNRLEGWRDCKPSKGTLTLVGTDEPKLKLEGMLGHMVAAGPTTVASDYTSGGTSLVVADAKRFVGIGTKTNDTIKIQVGSEIFLVSAVDYDTNTLTVAGAQDGSSAANHSTGAAIEPYKPGADPDANDRVIPLTLGSTTLGSATPSVQSHELVYENNFEARIDEWAEPALTGYRPKANSTREVLLTSQVYQDQTMQALLSLARREASSSLTIVCGASGRPALTVTASAARAKTPTKIGGAEFSRGLPFDLIETNGNDEVKLRFTAS